MFVPDQPPFQFSPDRPIASRDADLLDRTDFAEQVATAIRSWTDKDSLVLALYGEWGAGKSSIKNLIVDSLNSTKATSPHIVEFDPWQWAGQEQLAHAFFGEIGKALGQRDSTKEARKSARRWLKYAALLGLGTEAFSGIRRLALAVLVLISILGFLGALFPIIAIRWVLGIIAGLSAVGFALFKMFDGFAKHVANYLSLVVDVEARSLEDVKKELSASLRALPRPMLVVIDDIDRLTGPELKLLFQLVKANADFPNLVYLMMFQRNLVEDVLSAELSIDGREYLKKIVQVGFDVPRAQQSKVERTLFKQLDVLLAREAVQELWDNDRWIEVYLPGLRPYFATLRDVYRFISALSFHFAVFWREGVFEVNPVDLIALEVLRVFEPDVYKALSTLKESLNRTEFGKSALTKAATGEKSPIEAIVQRASESHRTSVEEIVTQLFPQISNRGSPYYPDSWYRQRRVCDADVFDKYFQFTVSEGDLSHAEIVGLVAVAGDRSALVNKLKSLRERGLLAVAIDRLESYKETISLDHAIPFITAIFDSCDELPIQSTGLSEIPIEMHAARIVYWYLKREPILQKRQEIFDDCIKQTTGIYLQCFVVAWEGDRLRNPQPNLAALTDEDGVKRLQQSCVSKIGEASLTPILIGHPRLGQLLGFWQQWGKADDVQSWVSTQVESRDGLLGILVTGLVQGMKYGHSRYVGKPFWQFDLAGIERVIDPAIIEQRLEQIGISSLTEKEKQAAEAFQTALNRKRAGKPPMSPLNDE